MLVYAQCDKNEGYRYLEWIRGGYTYKATASTVNSKALFQEAVLSLLYVQPNVLPLWHMKTLVRAAKGYWRDWTLSPMPHGGP